MTKIRPQQKFSYLLLSYLFLFLIFALFSFVFTDPNLTLINNNNFTIWQTFLWQKILPNLYLRSGIYLALVTLLFFNYIYLLRLWPSTVNFFNKKRFIFFSILIFILLISYNALSHDIFNYIFNARMLVKYRANPHQIVALNFADDPWSRFMHNIHTTAPYGQLWTYISTIPYFFGLNKFLITWLNFKAFAFLGMAVALIILNKLLSNDKDKNSKLALLLLNPLILIETVINGHNDWWMMWPVLASFLLAKKFNQEKKKKYYLLVLIIILMFFSIFTKFASLVALPFVCYLLIEKNLEKLVIFQNKYLKKVKIFINLYFWDIISITFFFPLFTARSQRFLTWYLIWPMAFLPLLKGYWWRNNLLIFSITALLSYLPWIIYIPWLNFDRSLPNVLLFKQALLWLPVLSYNIFYLTGNIIKNVQNKR